MAELYSPVRQCKGCMLVTDKEKLVRVADSPEGVKLDLYGKSQGRGCYVCKDYECLNKALKKNAFQRSFKHKISKDELNKIEEDFLTLLSKNIIVNQ